MFIWILLGCICCTLFLMDRLHNRPIRSVITKVLTSTCFFLMGWMGVFNNENLSLTLWLLAGLFFGLMGDMWLGLKWAYPKQDIIYTFLGFAFFALEHVFILIGLNVMSHHYILLILSILIGAGICYFVVSLEKKMSLNYGLFKGVTLVYGTVLIACPVYNLILCFITGFAEFYLGLFIAGICFLASDLILSGTYFGKGKDKAVHIISNHILYFLAQFIIAYIIYII